MNVGRCRITEGVVILSLLLVIVHDASAGMRFASDLKTTASCQIETCYDIFSSNTTWFLLNAPCPPPSNFSLICEYRTTTCLSCDERTVIIKKCLHVYPQELKCDIVEQCEHLECLSFRTLLNDCVGTVENDIREPVRSSRTDEKVVILNVVSTQTDFTLAHRHSKMTQVTESTVVYSDDNYVQKTDDFPQPLREEKDNLVWLAALLLLLIPLIFIIWFCCKRRKSQKDNKYPKQEDASSTAGLCKTVSSLNECSPTAQSGDFENLDLPYIDSEELQTVHTESPPHVGNTVVT